MDRNELRARVGSPFRTGILVRPEGTWDVSPQFIRGAGWGRSRSIDIDLVELPSLRMVRCWCGVCDGFTVVF
jgi:hypothetical protein